MMSRPTLVTGACGTLGQDVCRILAELGHPVMALGRVDLDVRDHGQVMAAVERLRPARVIHLAALTDVDGCERNPAAAHATNTLGTRHVALACQKYNVELIYVSTLAVFNGQKLEAYLETDTPDPGNTYGRSKCEAEQLIRRLVARHYIARAGWMFGGGPQDKKFVSKILAQAREGAELRAVDDKFGSPTYTVDFARGLERLSQTGQYGTYHLVNAGQPASRYEVARQVIRATRLEHCQVVPVGSDAFPLAAPRPRMEAGRNDVLESRGCHWMRPWQAALEEYVHTLS